MLSEEESLLIAVDSEDLPSEREDTSEFVPLEEPISDLDVAQDGTDLMDSKELPSTEEPDG